jgi:hypothetical protein
MLDINHLNIIDRSDEALELYFILKSHGSWVNEDEERHLKAKAALYTYREALCKHKPSDEPVTEKWLSQDYSTRRLYFYRMEEALKEQRYTRVCNEIISLMHNEPFFQEEIYYKLVKFLEGIR